MNSSIDAETILRGLNRAVVNELIPFYVILGLLMIFGLLGNTLVLLFIWRKAGKCIASFFILILASVDSLVCLTISLVIFEYCKIYIFTNDTICELYVFSKFFTALFSGFVLVTIAVYRYRQICRPLNGQLSLRGARLIVGCLIFLVLALSFPQIFFAETAELEVPNEYNVTVIGSGCTLKSSNNKLKLFQTILEGIYVLCFIGSSGVLIILYCLQARSIIELNRNMSKFKHMKDHPYSSQSTSYHSEGMSKTIETGTDGIYKTLETTTTNNSSKENQKTRQKSLDRQSETKASSTASSTKITVMFFFITLGFIVSFMPYITYSLWRNFSASQSAVLFIVSPLNLFCLNSYLINSVINPVIYAFFHLEFRQYLTRLLFCWRK